jgi:hypothetical protein
MRGQIHQIANSQATSQTSIIKCQMTAIMGGNLGRPRVGLPDG